MREPRPPVPEPDVERIRRGSWPSIVWLVPILALAGAVFLLIENIATRGPLITISFASASGLKAGESVVRYRDVDVGRVEAIRFSPDLASVLADVRMDQAVAPYLDETAKFWIVRPQVSAQGITGLETVISGTYIEGAWDTEAGQVRDHFVGAESPPPTPEGTPGLRISLTATDGSSLEVGSPVLFKGLEVGRIEEKKLSEDGSTVEFLAFIRAPNDRHITEATRFWNASGVDLQLGSDGARLRIASLSSLLRGGASFANFGAGDAPTVQPGHVFNLFPSQGDAAENAETGNIADAVRLQVSFAGSVRGLQQGATVEYRGIRIGRVLEVSAAVDPANGEFRTNTIIGLSPSLLGLEDADREGLLRFLDGAVAKGLRAKLAMGNLLTGSLYVNLEDDPTAPPATFDPARRIPELPAVASDIDELAGSVEGILKRVDALPVETLLGNAVTLLENVNRIVADENTRQLPERALGVLSATEALVARPELGQAAVDAQALVAALRAIAEDPALKTAPVKLDALLASLGALSAELQRQDTAADLAATIAALRAVAESPHLKLLPDQANRALTAMTALLEQPSLTAVPEQIVMTLADVRKTLDMPGLTEVPADLRKTLASVRTRLDDPALATALNELTPLLAETRAAIRGASTRSDEVLKSLSAILDDPGTRAAPAEIAATLKAARTVLEDDGLKAASGEAAATLAALRKILEDPKTRAAPGELTETLASARALLKSLEDAKAAQNLARSLAAAQRLLEDPALTRASNELATTLAALRAVLETEGAKDLPPALVETLTSATALIEDFRRQNVAASTAGAMDGVRSASAAAEKSLARVPALVTRLTEVSKRADSLLASVDVGSELNYEAVTAIREIRDAARAITDLVDLIQRRPNSIILGK